MPQYYYKHNYIYSVSYDTSAVGNVFPPIHTYIYTYALGEIIYGGCDPLALCISVNIFTRLLEQNCEVKRETLSISTFLQAVSSVGVLISLSLSSYTDSSQNANLTLQGVFFFSFPPPRLLYTPYPHLCTIMPSYSFVPDSAMLWEEH